MKNSIVQIYTGDGKGKTTAAFGQAVRAIGGGYSVYILQFLKNSNTSEYKFAIDNSIPIKTFNNQSVFVWDMDEHQKKILQNESEEGFNFLIDIEKNTDCQLVILDEIIWAISMNFIYIDKFIKFIKNKRDDLDLVITGCEAQQELIDIADLVTEMKMVKHPYEKGNIARKGIEF